MDRILITGIGGPAGRSCLRYFGGKGYRTIGTDIHAVEPKADVFHLLPPAADSSFEGALLRLIQAERPSLFIPTVTEELVKVARLKNEIETLGCTLFTSSPEAVEIANDKLKTARFMESKGVAVPATFDGSADRAHVIAGLGLPLLAKPCFGRGGRGVVIYGNADDVMKERRESIIFQEFIPGAEYDVNIFAGKGGLVETSIALLKTEMKEGVIGNAVSVERAINATAVELCSAAARLLMMEGPLDFDVRLRENGEPVLLEINARVGGNVLHAAEVLEALEKTWRRKRNNVRI